ncbi:hypothetical protein B0H15DRAFT_856612 [Mycena belliarum]|uniref:F-box domain-containing protein n=1 Tax=Mycena belliarum TaxID=1033014 RepID=A0AAD6XMM5_9AGAR|nr:hypothetical protein B0H15DRAFT_856612 [Mycena belliae]
MNISSLPTELLNLIVGHTTLQDLLSLSQTTRHIHAICLETIYCTVTLEDRARALKCCSTIVSRQEASDSVREFKILCSPNDSDSDDPQSFEAVFTSAMIQMKNLRVVHVHSRSLFELFSSMNFPRLSACTLPISLEIGSFLQSNPTVTSLVLQPGMEGPFPGLGSSPVQAIHLPRLRRFGGPAISTCSFIPGSCTSHITIFWTDSQGIGFPEGLQAAARSNNDIVDLGHFIDTWDHTLLPAIASHLPHIRTLQITKSKHIPELPLSRERFLASFDDALRSLTCLEALTVITGADGTQGIDDDALIAEGRLLQRWGEISPRLSIVSLPSNTLWIRARSSVWFPSKVSSDEHRSGAERQQWLLNEMFPNEARIEVAAQAVKDFIADRAEMEALRDTLNSMRLQLETTSAMSSWMGSM